MRYISIIIILILVIPLTSASFDEIFDYSEELSYSEEEENPIVELLNDPVSPAAGDWERLLVIPGIDEEKIRDIKVWTGSKKISSPEDMIRAGVSREIVEAIHPYLTYSDNSRYVKGKLALEWKDKLGTSRTSWRVKAGDIKLGLMGKKEDGENWSDIFHPFYCEYNCYPLRIVTGCYKVRWGQGLVQGKSFSMGRGKSAGSIINKQLSLIKPYLSSYENMYQRGVAVGVKLGVWELNYYFSDINPGVNFDDSLCVKSFTTEIEEDRQTVAERLHGLAVIFRRNQWSAGILGENSEYSHEILDLDGEKECEIYSGWLNYHSENVDAGCEFAAVNDQGSAIVYSGFGSKDFRQYLYLNSYSKEITAVHGNPISRKSDPTGERGIYYGFTLNKFRSLKVNCSAELYNFNAPRYLIDLPTGGREWRINCIYGEGKDYLELKGKERSKENYAVIADSGRVILERTSQWQLEYNQQLSEIRLRSSICYRQELVDGYKYDHGIYFYQQFSRKIKKINLWLRVTAFRGSIPLYLYENNIRYSHKQVCLSGDGYRFSVMSSYSNSGFIFELKYYYEGAELMEQGLYLGINYSL